MDSFNLELIKSFEFLLPFNRDETWALSAIEGLVGQNILVQRMPATIIAARRNADGRGVIVKVEMM